MSQSDFPEGGGGGDIKLLDLAARCTICYQIYDAPLCLRGCGHSCTPPGTPPPLHPAFTSPAT